MANGDITRLTTITGTTSNGSTIQSFSNSKTYSSIAQEIQRTLTVPITTPVTLVTIGAAVAGATLVTMNNFTFKNEDASNTVEVGVLTASSTFYIKVGPGEDISIVDSTIDANVTGGTVTAYENIVTINACALVGACVCTFKAF